MARLKLNEQITIAFSVLALALSAASAWYTVLRDRRQDTESLAVSINPERGDYETELLGFVGERPSQIVLNWHGFIANNGSIPVSIVSFDVWGVGKPNLFTHSHMNLGLFDSDGKQIVLPMVVEPGHATPIEIRTGVMLATAVEGILGTRFPIGQKVRYIEVLKHVARSGKDLFGNDIKYQEFGDNTYSFEGPDPSRDVRQPVFLWSFSTARSNKFTFTSSFYGQ